LWLEQNRLAEPLDWVRQCNLSVDDDLDYIREFEHITLAGVLLAHAHTRSVVTVRRFLDRALQAAEQGGRIDSVIEILVLQALSYDVRRDIRAGVASLQRTTCEFSSTRASPCTRCLVRPSRRASLARMSSG
jgi:LuxR family transcriptional regulator, maltose regulon positive regulatory protein